MKLKKILSIELQKVIPYSSFWVIISILLGLLILFTLSVPFFESSILGDTIEIKNYFKFPIIWNTTTWIASFFNHLLSILIIVLIGNEFNYRTFKQNIIDGITKYEIVVGKLIIMLILTTLYIIIVNILTLGLGINFSDTNNSIFENYYYNFTLFLQTFGLMCFAMMIVFFVKNTALSIIIYIGYFIFELIVRGILNLRNLEIYKYLPMKIILNLTPTPSLQTALGNQDATVNFQNIDNSSEAFDLSFITLISVIYISIFLFLSFYRVKKQNF